jgi:hypothetical protein
MKKEQITEIAILKLKDAILSKEMITIRAHRDTSQYGKWMCDYDSWIRECEQEIEGIKEELNSLM